MDFSLFSNPSFYAHLISGLLILFALLLLFFYYRKVSLSFYQKLVLLLLIAIVIGIHGISHHQMEVDYHFNPLDDLFMINSSFQSHLY
jgi:uncharacterized membrane protein HdeD (DUF308 family)